MKMQANVICTAIKESKGDYEGRAFSSTTFHLSVDLPDNTSGRSIGAVTRPFKMGDAGEFDKWMHLDKSWSAAGLPCLATFDMVAGSDNTSKVTLLALAPIEAAKRAAPAVAA